MGIFSGMMEGGIFHGGLIWFNGIYIYIYLVGGFSPYPKNDGLSSSLFPTVSGKS